MIFNELTTVSETRVDFLDPLKLTTDTDDALLLSFIRSLSAALTSNANRRFVPIITTYTYDIPRRWNLNPISTIPRLDLDDDLLEVLTLTNGDGTVLASNQYSLYPLNDSVKNQVALKFSSGLAWQTNVGDEEGVISINGVWAYHEDYGSAWQDTTATLQASINASVTALTAQSNTIRAGYLLKLDSEYLYASAITSGNTIDTITVARGVNGSTAASHTSGAHVYRWYQPALDGLLRVAVAGAVKLRDNPTGEVVRVGPASFSTPKDVLKYIDAHVALMGVNKVGIG